MRNDEATYGYVNLLALVDSLLVEFEGDDGIFIPFRSNPSIFVSDRAVNLLLSIRPLKSGRDLNGNTHAAFANARQEVLDAMTDEDKKILLPFLGKFFPYKPKNEDKMKIISGKPVVKRIVDEVPPDPVRDKDEYDGIPF